MSKGKAAAAERDASRRSEELTGVFESIRWQNDDGTYIIGTLQSGQSIKGNARAGSFIRGCEYTFGGFWDSGNGKFGPTFIFKTCQPKAPVTREAVVAYLMRHLAGTGCGIGDVSIKKIITQYGPDKAIDTIKNHPKDIASFLGLDLQKAIDASNTMKRIEKFETTRIQLTQLFEGRGFPQSTVEACIDTFGVNAVDAIKRDPFTMLVRGFHGCGFLRVNALYEALNLPKARLKRQVICMWHMLTEGNGSVWYDAEWVGGRLASMISSDVKFVRAVKLGVRAKWLSTFKCPKTRRVWLASREHAAVENELVLTLSGFIDRLSQNQSQNQTHHESLPVAVEV